MARIVYLLLSEGGLTGGQKMLVRHVETLCDLGFDALIMLGAGSRPPQLSHRAPVRPAFVPEPDDMVVIPSDATDALAASRDVPWRLAVFDQNVLHLAEGPIAALDALGARGMPPLITVSPGSVRLLQRLYPSARVELVPCFADERIFRPLQKTPVISCAPRKREWEAKIIHNLFRRLHPEHEGLRWGVVRNAPETEVAQTFGTSSLHLALGRLESVGLSTLEAMACGCVCAGFTGVGGAEFATDDNGFWVADDDCLAATEALAAAADLVQTGGPPLKARIEAALETARQWSYARFRTELERVWMELAPETRRRARSPAC